MFGLFLNLQFYCPTKEKLKNKIKEETLNHPPKGSITIVSNLIRSTSLAHRPRPPSQGAEDATPQTQRAREDDSEQNRVSALVHPRPPARANQPSFAAASPARRLQLAPRRRRPRRRAPARTRTRSPRCCAHPAYHPGVFLPCPSCVATTRETESPVGALAKSIFSIWPRAAACSRASLHSFNCLSSHTNRCRQ